MGGVIAAETSSGKATSHRLFRIWIAGGLAVAFLGLPAALYGVMSVPWAQLWAGIAFPATRLAAWSAVQPIEAYKVAQLVMWLLLFTTVAFALEGSRRNTRVYEARKACTKTDVSKDLRMGRRMFWGAYITGITWLLVLSVITYTNISVKTALGLATVDSFAGCQLLVIALLNGVAFAAAGVVIVLHVISLLGEFVSFIDDAPA